MAGNVPPPGMVTPPDYMGVKETVHTTSLLKTPRDDFGLWWLVFSSSKMVVGWSLTGPYYFKQIWKMVAGGRVKDQKPLNVYQIPAISSIWMFQQFFSSVFCLSLFNYLSSLYSLYSSVKVVHFLQEVENVRQINVKVLHSPVFSVQQWFA